MEFVPLQDVVKGVKFTKLYGTFTSPKQNQGHTSIHNYVCRWDNMFVAKLWKYPLWWMLIEHERVI
jgi:hypothetical protein